LSDLERLAQVIEGLVEFAGLAVGHPDYGVDHAQGLALRRPLMDAYERESSARFATARLWDDGIIDPLATRDVLGLTLAVVHQVPIPAPRHGVLRM
jgi:3-methylcrotonyl-CoA carboxylase beta subunit